MSEKLLLLMLHTLIDDNGQVVFQFTGRDDLVGHLLLATSL